MAFISILFMEKSSPLKVFFVFLLILLPFCQLRILNVDFFGAKLIYAVAIWINFKKILNLKIWILVICVPLIISYIQSIRAGSTEHESLFIGILNLALFNAVFLVKIHKYLRFIVLYNTYWMLLFALGIGVESTPEGPIFMSLNQNLFSLYIFVCYLLSKNVRKSQILNVVYTLLSIYSILVSESRYIIFMLVLWIIYAGTRQLKTAEILRVIPFKKVVMSFVLCIMIYVISNMSETELNDLSSRALIWYLAVEQFDLFTALGYGHTSVVSYLSLSLSSEKTSIHNVIIEVMLSSGLVGLFLFIFWIAKLFVGIDRTNPVVTFSFLVVLVYGCIGQFFGDLIVWYLIALVYEVGVYSRNVEVWRKGKAFASFG